jgi:hypothetical protein
VDPVAIGAVLAAIVGGVGEGLGEQLWAGVRTLVARPFRHPPGPQAGAVADGSAELVALQQAPTDQQRAVALAEVLLARAADDGEFAQALAAWWNEARHLPAAGNVANTISGGTQHGPVVQGRDFSGLTFTTPPAAPPSAPNPGT